MVALKDYTITTPGGCTLVVNGELTLGKNKTFKGTIKLSGSCPLPNGTYEFKSASRPPSGTAGGKLTVTLDGTDPASMSMRWAGEPKLAALLNDEPVRDRLAEAIRRAGRAPATVDQAIQAALAESGIDLTAPVGASLGAFAKVAGAVHGAVVSYYREQYREAKGDIGRLLKQALGDLEAARAVTAGEAAMLAEIAEAIATQRDPSAAATRIRSIRDRLQADSKATACALTMAGIALDSTESAVRDSAPPAGAPAGATPRRFGDWRRVAGGDLLGGLAGWMLGLALTLYSPVGGAVGAVVGAIAVSTAMALEPT